MKPPNNSKSLQAVLNIQMSIYLITPHDVNVVYTEDYMAFTVFFICLYTVSVFIQLTCIDVLTACFLKLYNIDMASTYFYSK